ncbi:MAG: hypothetical protein WDW38_004625 [Sanguina aurantia]
MVAAHAAPPAAGVSNGVEPSPGTSTSIEGLMALHKTRLFDWKPSPIVAISACPGLPLAAIALECGDLEVWDLEQLTCIQRVTGTGLEITAVAWALDSLSSSNGGSSWRTFAAFLDGTIAEVCWSQGCIAHSTDSYGGVVWSMAAKPAAAVKPGFPQSLAAACDDGGVRLFTVEGGEPGVQLDRLLITLQGKLLALAWHPAGRSLAVAGLTVWRLLVLADGTLVSGDSEGGVAFWDGRLGTRLARFQKHAADVMALAATPDGSSVFASGVDSQVAEFQRSKASGPHAASSEWAYLHHKRPHTHDVRALAVVTLGGQPTRPGKAPRAHAGSTPAGAPPARLLLLSGGVDAQLIAYPALTFLQQHPTRLSRCPQSPMCSVSAPAAAHPGDGGSGCAGGGGSSRQAPRLVTAQHNQLDVWGLGTGAPLCVTPAMVTSASGKRKKVNLRPSESDAVELTSGPRHISRITTSASRILSASISPEGTHVLACTTTGPRIYKLPASHPSATSTTLQQPPTLQRVPLPGLATAVAASTPVVCGIFTSESNAVLARSDGALLQLQLPPAGGSAVGVQTTSAPSQARPVGTSHQLAWRHFALPVSGLASSPDGRWLAAHGPRGVHLFSLPSLTPHGKALPCGDHNTSVISGLAFSPDGQLLAAITPTATLHLWEVATGKPSAWIVEHGKSAAQVLDRLTGVPAGMSFDPDPKLRRLLIHSTATLVHLDLAAPLTLPCAAAEPRRRRGRNVPTLADLNPWARPELTRGTNGRTLTLSEPTIAVAHMGGGAVLLMEKPWEDVLGGMPAPLFRRRYGS